MTDRAKVAEALRQCAGPGCDPACPYFHTSEDCFDEMKRDAALLIERGSVLSAQEQADLAVIAKIRAGESRKIITEDYVIFNGKFWKNYAAKVWSQARGGGQGGD